MNEGAIRILVVDDDPTDFVFLKKAFEGTAANIQLFHCCSARDAVGMAEQNACRLVLLDLNLNGESGIGALKAIRENQRLRTVPVIILSSSASAADIAESCRLGANAYIEKPLTMDLYRKTAKAVADFWFETAILPQ